MSERIIPKTTKRVVDDKQDSDFVEQQVGSGAENDSEQKTGETAVEKQAIERQTADAEQHEAEVDFSEIDAKIERGKAYSSQKAQEHQSASSQSTKQTDTPADKEHAKMESISANLPKKPSFWQSFKGWLLWGLLFVVVIASLWLTRPDADWQIQRINDLQAQLDVLDGHNQQLQIQLTEQQQQLETLADPSNKPLLSEGDIDQFKQQTQQQLTELEQQLNEISKQAGQQVDSSLQQLNEMAQKLPDQLQLSPENKQQLQQLEKQMTDKLQGFSQQLSQLFSKQQSLEQQTQQNAKTTDTTQPLDSLQIQQWIVDLNTQWILHGRPQQSRQQLMALEQAVNLSQLSYAPLLNRLIGEDLAYLKDYQSRLMATRQQFEPQLRALYQAISELQGPEDIAGKATAEQSAQTEMAEKTAETDIWQGLLNKFSQMITLKKRTEEGEMAQVESLIMGDVLKQRLALLVDRLKWAIDSQSADNLQQSRVAIGRFIEKYFPQDQMRFTELLAPFDKVSMLQPETLAIMSLDQRLNSSVNATPNAGEAQ